MLEFEKAQALALVEQCVSQLHEYRYLLTHNALINRIAKAPYWLASVNTPDQDGIKFDIKFEHRMWCEAIDESRSVNATLVDTKVREYIVGQIDAMLAHCAQSGVKQAKLKSPKLTCMQTYLQRLYALPSLFVISDKLVNYRSTSCLIDSSRVVSNFAYYVFYKLPHNPLAISPWSRFIEKQSTAYFTRGYPGDLCIDYFVSRGHEFRAVSYKQDYLSSRVHEQCPKDVKDNDFYDVCFAL